MKRLLLFLLLLIICFINLSFAGESEEKEIATGQITDRCTKYMTAIKYKDWDEAYNYISSRTYKGNFVQAMKDYWEENQYNSYPPKYLGFYIDKIKFNDYMDEAEVWFTEKLNIYKRDQKSSWTESEFPRIFVWVKQSDGEWYRDYGNRKERIE